MSATQPTVGSGALATRMPRAARGARSILSTPAPKAAITPGIGQRVHQRRRDRRRAAISAEFRRNWRARARRQVLDQVERRRIARPARIDATDPTCNATGFHPRSPSLVSLRAAYDPFPIYPSWSSPDEGRRPKEIRPHEYRVGLTPAAVRELVVHGHLVTVEKDAAAAIGFSDDGLPRRRRDHRRRGRRGVRRRRHADREGAKEPQPGEIAMLRPGQVVLAYLHLAADDRRRPRG
jgi:hypothetical protein